MIGILYVDDVIEHGLYTDEEEETISYSDLNSFMIERKSRSFHLSEGVIKIS